MNSGGVQEFMLAFSIMLVDNSCCCVMEAMIEKKRGEGKRRRWYLCCSIHHHLEGRRKKEKNDGQKMKTKVGGEGGVTNKKIKRKCDEGKKLKRANNFIKGDR